MSQITAVVSSLQGNYLRSEWPSTSCSEVMASQNGVISLNQCIASGLTKSAAYGRARSGRWRLILPKVFLDSSHAEGWAERCVAACRWGPSGALTSFTAAHLLGVMDPAPDEIDLLVVGSPKSPAPWLRIHSTCCLPGSDLRMLGPLQLTTPERTLVELAGHVSVRRLEMTLDAVLRERLSTLPRIAERVGDLRIPGRAGTATLSALLAERTGDRRPVESALETLLKRLMKDGSLPPVTQQFVVSDGSGFVGRLDFAFPESKVAIEADSVKHHLNRRSFEEDRARDVRLISIGWKVLRFTYRQIVDKPAFVLGAIQAALELSP